jgi:hypothetical protein
MYRATMAIYTAVCVALLGEDARVKTKFSTQANLMQRPDFRSGMAKNLL